MKLIRLFLLAGFLLSATVAGANGLSDNQRLLGYCLGDSITVKNGAFGTEGEYIVGAVITPKMLSAYKGCRIVGIRLAVGADLGRTRTFLYNIANDFDVLVEQKQRLYTGWNNVFFNGDGYLVNGGETLFFGFDYSETAAMVAADEGGLCGVGDDTDGGFYAYGDFGKGISLYQLSGIGRLCVQLIVDVSSLPRYSMNLLTLDAGFKYKLPGEGIDAMITMTNSGRDDIDSYQLGYAIDHGQPVWVDRADTLLSGKMGSAVFALRLPDSIAVGMHTLSVFVSQIAGQPFTGTADTLSASFAVYRETLGRSKVYMEVYTDASSPYAPFLNDAVGLLLAADDRLAVVNVHRPSSALAVSEAAYLHDLYAYTWPTFTINRAYFPGEAYISYDMNDYLPVVPADMCAAILSDMVAQDFYTPSFATVGLSASYDADSRQLTVTARGQLLPEAEAIYGGLALTLMLSEDGVKSRQAVYNSITQRTTYNQNYRHPHVLRAYLTRPTGDALTVADGRYEATYTTTLPAGWQPENMQVVALLTKQADSVTDDNVLDMDVVNADCLSLDATVGITAPVVASDEAPVFYTLDGKRIATSRPSAPGIYVQRTADGKARKVVIR
jgi:hypothetical protein